MSSSDPLLRAPLLRLPRRAALLLVAGAVAGCGLTPAFAPQGPALALRDAVQVEAPSTVEGYRLRQHLTDRLGTPAAAPAYVLVTTLAIGRDAVAVSRQQETTRYNLVGNATWALRRAGSDAVLLDGQVDSFTGYLATGSTIATRTSENDARDRLALALADLIVARLVAGMAGLEQ